MYRSISPLALHLYTHCFESCETRSSVCLPVVLSRFYLPTVPMSTELPVCFQSQISPRKPLTCVRQSTESCDIHFGKCILSRQMESNRSSSSSPANGDYTEKNTPLLITSSYYLTYYNHCFVAQWTRKSMHKSTQVFDFRSICVSFGYPLAFTCDDLTLTFRSSSNSYASFSPFGHPTQVDTS